MSFFWGRGLGVVLSFWLVLTTPVTVLRVAGQSADVPASQATGKRGTSAARPLEIMVLRRRGENRPPTEDEVERFTKLPKLAVQSHLTPEMRVAAEARRALIFRTGAALLRQAGVGFEPYQLLQPGWYQQLRLRLVGMPGYQSVRRLGERLQGVVLADTVVTPEQVEVTGRW